MTHTPGVFFTIALKKGGRGVLHRYIDHLPVGWAKTIKPAYISKAAEKTETLCVGCEARYRKELRIGIRRLGDAIAFAASQIAAKEAERAAHLERFLVRVPADEEPEDERIWERGLFVTVRGHVQQWMRKAHA